MCALLVVILSAIRWPLPIANSDSRRVLLGQHGVCLRAEGSELVPPRRRYFVLLCLDPLDRAIVISVGLGRIAAARMTHGQEEPIKSTRLAVAFARAFFQHLQRLSVVAQAVVDDAEGITERPLAGRESDGLPGQGKS